MATTHAAVGLNHPTAVPENFDPDGEETGDRGGGGDPFPDERSA